MLLQEIPCGFHLSLASGGVVRVTHVSWVGGSPVARLLLRAASGEEFALATVTERCPEATVRLALDPAMGAFSLVAAGGALRVFGHTARGYVPGPPVQVATGKRKADDAVLGAASSPKRPPQDPAAAAGLPSTELPAPELTAQTSPTPTECSPKLRSSVAAAQGLSPKLSATAPASAQGLDGTHSAKVKPLAAAAQEPAALPAPKAPSPPSTTREAAAAVPSPSKPASRPAQAPQAPLNGGPGGPAGAVAEAAEPEKKPKPRKKPKPTMPLVPLATHMLLSGVRAEVWQRGTGPQARPGAKVQVKYEGRLAGKSEPFECGTVDFRLGIGDVIEGWDIGVNGMLQGEHRRLFVPARLAYGPEGQPPKVPPQSDLEFRLELLRC